MNPSRLAEPRALAVVFTALVLVAALLVFTVGAGSTVPATDEAPITRERPDRLPSIAEGEAAGGTARARAQTKPRLSKALLLTMGEKDQSRRADSNR